MKASALLLYQVLLQPVQKMLIIILSSSNAENQADQFLIGIGKLRMIDGKKHKPFSRRPEKAATIRSSVF